MTSRARRLLQQIHSNAYLRTARPRVLCFDTMFDDRSPRKPAMMSPPRPTSLHKQLDSIFISA